MNLNYDKIKSRVEHGGNHWTSYSDLFLVLSIIFLLLYVVANLRNGANSISNMSALKTAQAEAEELRKQIKVYEVLKNDYVNKGASQEEVQLYRELMDKMSLLETEAKQEADQLYKQAEETRQKQDSLNQYQAMVKNIINANLVAQSRLKKREETIEQKDQELTEKTRDIDALNTQVKSREREIERNSKKIANIQDQLQNRIEEVKAAYSNNQKSKEKMEAAIRSLRAESQTQIKELEHKNTQYVSQLETTQQQLQEKNRESEKLLASLNKKEEQFNQSIEELKRAHEETVKREQKGFEEGQKRAQLSAETRLTQEREHRAEIERQNMVYNEKLKGLQGELDNTRKNISDISAKYQDSIGSLTQSNEALKKSLQASTAKLNQQKELAERIRKNFGKAGIDADIDPKTGDVTVHFRNEYFETGSSSLKTGMKSILEKMIPVYAKSLFEDDKVVKKIASVEVIGFASPTYKGKYVDPDSLTGADRKAVNFNMDLSYQRAKSIFEYTFDTRKMSFSHQKQLLPLVKVSGRSYLATERLQNRTTANIPDGQYCQIYDCKKSQRVIIRFNLKD